MMIKTICYGWVWCYLLMCWGNPLIYCQDIYLKTEIASSLNPVGSGARALGMGGAFIGVADDATAASWNPGGLIQLEKKEFSIVGSYFSRTETNQFDFFSQASGNYSIDQSQLNYLSLAYPFIFNQYDMIVSINYQHLYEFYRAWGELNLSYDQLSYDNTTRIHYDQEGDLYALGLAYCIRINPKLSTGLTLNYWGDALNDNQWEQHYVEMYSNIIADIPQILTSNRNTTYDFKGFNFNLGFLYRFNEEWTLGGVFKSPFKADIDRHITQRDSILYPKGGGMNASIIQPEITRHDQLSMPMSYGFGIAYRKNDQITVSFDVYQTRWDDYKYIHEDGGSNSPISGRTMAQSDVDPTTWFRCGMEYLMIGQQTVFPLRAGIFYDPAPAEGSPDKYLGLALGSGFVYEFKEKQPFIQSLIFDIAYQWRVGNNVGQSLLEETSFSQDIYEHKLYGSLIVHFY